MKEQLAELYLNDDENAWELVGENERDPIRTWDVEAKAVRDLQAGGWGIEGPFERKQEFADMPHIRVWGNTLRRSVQ
jgi:hypothetical protein